MKLRLGDSQWQEFIDRLNDAMDWQGDLADVHTYTWKCGRDGDRLALSKEVAREMGFEGIDLGDRTICCDCEIVFNLSEEC